MKQTFDIKHHDDGTLSIKTFLTDFASEDLVTLPVTITINNQGVEITPTEQPDKYTDGVFEITAWTEYYLGALRTMLWDGTQEDPNVTFIHLEK